MCDAGILQYLEIKKPSIIFFLNFYWFSFWWISLNKVSPTYLYVDNICEDIKEKLDLEFN